MAKQPLDFTINFDQVDTKDFPKDSRKTGSGKFKRALKRRLEKEYAPLGGSLTIRFSKESVAVNWNPDQIERDPLEYAISLLQAGKITEATPLLEGFLKATPNNPDVLYNLGMVYSDKGRLKEAIDLLEKAIDVSPNRAHAYVALGTAQMRLNQVDSSEASLKKALDLKKDDPYALRSLGTVQMSKLDHESAEQSFRNASKLLPDDPIVWLNLGECLLKFEKDSQTAEADECFTKAIHLAPPGPVQERAKEKRRTLAHHTFRERGDIRMDAVMYCLDALQKLKPMTKQQVGLIAMEIARKGESGLDVNNPDTRYSLELLPGDFSGLNLVCILHVALQIVQPGADSGFDVSKEYEMASSMYAEKT